MNDKVLSYIREHHMIQAGDTVIVGVSGGADSMCLLHQLCSLSKLLQCTVIAAHLNHGIRTEADSEEAYVREWCKKHSVPFFSERKNISELAKQQKIGLEICGRKERYAFFESIASRYQSAKIATAHTLSDQAETVLLHLTRGSGSRGLCGIAPVRGKLIRPLLSCTRSEIEEYCRENAISYVTDESNSDLSYSRNRIRHQVIPELNQINPNFADAIGRMTLQLTQQEKYMEQLAEAVLCAGQREEGVSVALLQKQVPILQDYCCRIAAERAGAQNLTESHILGIRSVLSGGSFDLPGNLQAESVCGILRFRPKSDAKGKTEPPIIIIPPQKCTFSGKSYTFSIIDAKFEFAEQKVYKKFVTAVLNYDTITAGLKLRHRIPGDAFTPAGRGCTKSVKKLFNEAKLLPEEREKRAILEMNGQICWIEGFGVAQAFSPRADTRQFLLIEEEST